MPMRARLFGHPIHIMLVHFPSALYPFSVLLDWIGFFAGTSLFTTSSLYVLIGGLSGGGIAMIFGLIDFMAIDSKSKAWTTAAIHGGLNVLWLLSFATMLGIRWKSPDDPVGISYLITVSLLVGGMLYSNYLGGELVLKHQIGLKN